MTVTVADNGLAFTSVAEMAGPSWAGRALGALIGLVGYPFAFAAVALLPAAAIPLTPSEAAEHDRL